MQIMRQEYLLWSSNLMRYIQILMTQENPALPLVETHENLWLFAHENDLYLILVISSNSISTYQN